MLKRKAKKIRIKLDLRSMTTVKDEESTSANTNMNTKLGMTKRIYKSRFLSILNNVSKSGNGEYVLYVPDRVLLKTLNSVIKWTEIQRYGITQVITQLDDSDARDSSAESENRKKSVILFYDMRALCKPVPSIALPKEGLEHVIYCTWDNSFKTPKTQDYLFNETSDRSSTREENESEYVLCDMLGLEAYNPQLHALSVPVFQMSFGDSWGYLSEEMWFFQGLLNQGPRIRDNQKPDIPLHQNKNFVDQNGLLSGIDTICQIHKIRKIGKIISIDGLNNNASNFTTILKAKFGVSDKNGDRQSASFNAISPSEREDVFMGYVDCNVIVMDRSVDMVTPLLTELSYGGILNRIDPERFCELTTGIKRDPRLDAGSENDQPPKPTSNTRVNIEHDFIWDELKSENFGDVGFELQKKLQNYDLKTSTKNKQDLKELSKILNKENITMSELLKEHVDISSDLLGLYNEMELDDLVEFEQDVLSGQISDNEFVTTIKEFVYNGVYADFRDILKLCCLYSLLRKGIIDRDYDQLNLLLIDQYGSVPLLGYLINLNECNLYVKRSKFQTFSKKSPQDFKMLNNLNKYMDLLNYIPQSTSSMAPRTSTADLHKNKKTKNGETHLSLSYCGVVPLMTRLVEYSFKISAVQPTLRLLNNISEMVHLNESQLLPISGTPPLSDTNITTNSNTTTTTTTTTTSSVSGKDGDKLKVIIVVLGGITMSEFSTLQQLNHHDKPNHEFIILSNTLISGYDYVSNNLNKSIM